MDQGLETSMWAPLSTSQSRFRQKLDGHDVRSRSVPPHVAIAVATLSPPAPVSKNGGGGGGGGSSASSGKVPPRPASLAGVQAFHRFEQTCLRLRWKSIDLDNSYNRALSASDWLFTAQDAERNFKVDFYEFYAWIEQAIVFLLLVFGITVASRGSNGNGNGSGAVSSHAYHHNVLRTLDEGDNPFHETLGSGEVKQALWKAKELRNRWKDAAQGKETPPLKMYDLKWIVMRVLGGLEEAWAVAGKEVTRQVSRGEQHQQQQVGHDEDGWEWMVETMDWEAY